MNVHTRDIPRVSKALESTQCFELVSVTEIRAAQYQLTSDLEPQVKELLKHTEAGLLRLQRREEMLRNMISRREISNQDETSSSVEEDEESDDYQTTDQQKFQQQQQQVRLQQLRTQKQNLLNEVDRLDRQTKSKSSLQ